MRALTVVLAVLCAAVLAGLTGAKPAQAQDGALTFLTIERPPFAFEQDGEAAGFSIDLMYQIAGELGQEVVFEFVDEFPTMLDAVRRAEVDGAISNISITSEREEDMDFSRPIFGSGLQVMIAGGASTVSVWDVVLRWQLLIWVLLAFGVLFGLGMLMWALERRNQAYFDLKAKDAMFPSFWWALNLVINGGFEVTVPRSVLGRVLGVAMVMSSLFIVSIFVANITAAMTVEAITGNIRSLDDLRGRSVGTTLGSTSSAFLDDRDVAHVTFADLQDLLRNFEAGELEAVVFDGPILAHYLKDNPGVEGYLLERLFRPEDYGIALPQGSTLREPINRTLLRFEETGRYDALKEAWFGRPE